MPSPHERTAIVIDTPPTSNGNLHVGHMAGPFLNADVHARYLRARGRDVVFSSGTDDSQTYVLASARRKGMAPEELCERSWFEIRDTLRRMGISLDGFAPYDDRYRAAVLDFVGRLYRAGRFERRTVRLPWSQRTGEFLVEGLVSGYCPVCLVESRGGLCESCGYPNGEDELIGPRSTVDPDDEITSRETEILVLPMEQYRERLVEFYDRRQHRMRPHTVSLVRELLASPLPDFPITYPIGWGIPAPFAETPDQRLNAWVEGIPAVMYCTAFAADEARGPVEGRADDELWRADHDAEVIYFIGFDNVWFWGLTHVALLMAHGDRYVLPDAIISNEFYELENDKLSTSLGNVLYTDDLLLEVPRDMIRFYLALTNPEHQRTNFSRAALDAVVAPRLVRPWDQLAEALNKLVEPNGRREPLPVSDAARARAAAVQARFRICYELESYSLTRAADLIVQQVDRLLRTALALDPAADSTAGAVADLFHELRALLGAASPILIDLAAASAAAGGFALRLDDDASAEPTVTPFTVPTVAAAAADGAAG